MTASTLTSDNGASSGTSGIKYNGGTDGTLQLQTTTSGGTATTALTIDNSQNTTLAGYLNAPNTFGFKNRIINGAMGIWQRGTTTGSVVGTTGPYMADRFYGYAGTGNITISQSSDVPSNFTYSCSMVGTGVSITQRIESKNCVDLAGATVTVSFWAKSTAGSDNLQVSLYTATAGVDNWGSQTSTANTVSASPAGTWTYYTTTFTGIPSTATNGVGVGIARGSNATSTTLITGVQLEKGSTATSFDYRPYGTELALCQRYYWRNGGSAQGGLYAPFATGVNTSTTNFSAVVQFPVRMRAAPSFAVGGSSPVIANGTYSSVTLDRVSLDQILLAINLTGATNGAANRYLGNSDGTTYWEFPAEL